MKRVYDEDIVIRPGQLWSSGSTLWYLFALMSEYGDVWVVWHVLRFAQNEVSYQLLHEASMSEFRRVL